MRDVGTCQLTLALVFVAPCEIPYEAAPCEDHDDESEFWSSTSGAASLTPWIVMVSGRVLPEFPSACSIDRDVSRTAVERQVRPCET